MNLIALHYLSEDDYFREMARLYWQTDKRNKFTYKVAELALRYNIRPAKLLRYVHDSAEAYIRQTRCALCGTPTQYLKRRADFYDVVRSQKWKLWNGEVQHFCNECQQVMDQRHKAKSSEKPQKSDSLLQSIFSSSEALARYKELRQEHYFVYPSVAFSVFIPLEVAEQYFTADWHEGYFYRCCADFLVCDAKGIPERVIDMPSSPKSQNEKDEQQFRERLLRGVGV